MMRSMYSGVSGLKNHQTRMDVIGNNIANINTNGYKKSRVVFKDTLYQKLRGATSPVSGGRGGTNPMGIGLGMGVSSVDQIHTATATTTTNKLTDLAIDGNGYFVLKNGQQSYYTRAGNFDFDKMGMLTNVSNGYNVQGWMADSNQTDASGDWPITIVPATTETINISDYKTCKARATTEMEFGKNLDSATTYNEIQTLTFLGAPEGGTAGGQFRLSFKGQNTAWISVGANATATAANIQTALENLGTIGAGNVAVSYNSTATSPHYEIMFQNDLASIDVPAVTFTAGPSLAFGTTPAIINAPGATTRELSFTGTAEGDPANSGFTLTFDGTVTTGPILVGATPADTATNILNALNEASLPNGAQASSVVWNAPTPNVYNITFSADPGVMTSTEVATLFDAGGCTVANFTPDVTFHPEELNSLITSRDVYDSIGNKQTVYFRFFKYGIDPGPPTRSNWACDISLDARFQDTPGYSPASNTVTGLGYEEIDITTGTPETTMDPTTAQIRRLFGIQFDDQGQFVADNANLFTLNLGIPPTSPYYNQDGGQDISFTIDFSDVTQYNKDSDAEATYQDGYGVGSMTGYTVGSDGVIRGAYDNGETRSLARLALANFENPAGMIQVGGTLFQESANSGTASINAPTISGLGALIPSSLEMSNVDLSEEFTDMIVTQRGFQANSRIITTSDEMIQELVNLKR